MECSRDKRDEQGLPRIPCTTENLRNNHSCMLVVSFRLHTRDQHLMCLKVVLLQVSYDALSPSKHISSTDHAPGAYLYTMQMSDDCSALKRLMHTSRKTTAPHACTASSAGSTTPSFAAMASSISKALSSFRAMR